MNISNKNHMYKDMETGEFLRLYPDGTIISRSFSPDTQPEDIIAGFHPRTPNMSCGQFSVIAPYRLKFTMRTPFTITEHFATMSQDYARLVVHYGNRDAYFVHVGSFNPVSSNPFYPY